MRAMGVATLIVMTAAGVRAGAPARAQSELVLQKEGSKEYHRPGCDLVKDAKGVLALTRGQAESRGLKPHADCDPSKAPQTPEPKPVFVRVDSGRYYHRDTCARLEKSSKALSLDEAGKKYWPCPTCRPPIRRPASGRSPR
jgi:hypothetical protein